MAYSRARVRGWQAAFWLALGALAACYNPSIVDGGLRCHSTLPQCPEDFVCGGDGTCHHANGTGTGGTGATGGKGGSGGAGGMGTGGGATGGSCVMAAKPAATCTPTAAPGTCDLSCQTGCGCNQKCSTLDRDAPACQPIHGNGRIADSCIIYGDGSDDCAPGNVCLTDGSQSRCFAFCSDNSQCPDSPCVKRLSVVNNRNKVIEVCDAPRKACSPWGGDGVCDNCYLSQPISGADQTVCAYWQGWSGNGDACRTSSDCIQGIFYCPQDVTGRSYQKCAPICDATHPCSSPLQVCTMVGSTFGFCSL